MEAAPTAPTTTSPTEISDEVRLEASFARELPELGVAWNAAEAPAPRLLVLNEPLAEELGLATDFLRSAAGLRLLVGTGVPEDATPVAQAYAGHQFGGYSPRLGDGRALLLGELRDGSGMLRDLHLKGAGRTPFARGGDGLAAVGPMLREYVISEAMAALRIPTTRSLAVTATGSPVRRETVLPGAVLARVASSHLRVGTFQFARSLDDLGLLRRLADHAIDRHYPEAVEAAHPYLALFESVVRAQASLVARWMLVGFVHGVMNTDNMTISGETIDYGPCAFMDTFDPRTVYSSIDEGGRYAYGNQPVVAEWNLARLAESLLPLFDADQDKAIEMAVSALEAFRPAYSDSWTSGMRSKLGVTERLDHTEFADLARELLEQLEQSHVDHTSVFRSLAGAVRGDREPVRGLFLDLPRFDDWLSRWLALTPDAGLMDRTNPVYIPRNHLVEEALVAATDGDLGPVEQLVDVVRRPFVVRPGLERYAEPPPEDFGRYVTYCGT